MLIGHVGRDIEVKFMPSGDAVANVGLATTETWKSKKTGERDEETTWHNLVFYGKNAEVAGEYVKKGDPIYVEGRIKNRKYEKDGVEKFITEVVVDRLQLLSGKRDGEQRKASPEPRAEGKSTGSASGAGGNFNDFREDIPF
jgi:single-strand DNA-binding protein